MSTERFFPDEKRSSEVYFGCSHKLEMGTHITILDTGDGTEFLPIRLHISVKCHKRSSILHIAYSTNCHNLTLNRCNIVGIEQE